MTATARKKENWMRFVGGAGEFDDKPARPPKTPEERDRLEREMVIVGRIYAAIDALPDPPKERK